MRHILAVALSALIAAPAFGQSAGTLALTGPSTTPGAPQLTPAAINAAVNAILSAKQDYNAPGLFTTLGVSGATTLLQSTGRDLTFSDGATRAEMRVANSNPIWSRSPFEIASLAAPQNKTEFTLLGFSGNTIPLTGSQTYALASGSANISGTSTSNQLIYLFSSQSSLDVSGAPNGYFNLRANLTINNNAKGGHTSFQSLATIPPGTTGLSSMNPTAITGITTVAANAGGTSSAATSGRAYGGYLQVGINTGSTFWASATGLEIDFATQTGASVGDMAGLTIVPVASHASHGLNNRDSGLVFGSANPVTGLDYAIRFGGTEASSPFETTASLLWVGRTMTLAYGFDGSNGTFTGGFLKSTGFLVNGSGDTTVNSLTTTGIVSANSGYKQNGSMVLNVGPFSTPQGQNTAAMFIGPGAGAAFPIATPDSYGTIGIGTNALASFITLGSETTAIGTWSAANLVTGSLNTVVGMHTLGAAVDATGVTGFGNDAFRDSFPGGYAVAVGQHAMAHGTPGTGSIAIGSQAIRGASASLVLSGTVTTGNQITVGLAKSGSSPSGLTGFPFSYTYTVVGGDTLTTIAAAIATAVSGANLSGPYIVVGCISEGNPDGTATVSFQWPGNGTVGWALTLTGSSNGTETVTVQAGSTASSSVAIGNSSMVGLGLVSVQANTFYGDSTATKLRTGSFNTAIGYQAGQNMTTPSNNTIVGATAGKAITTGAGNTILGFLTGTNLTTGGNNTIIGGGVAGTLTTGSGNIYVGGGIALDAGSSSESHVFRLGDHATNLIRATSINTATPAVFLDWLPGSTSYANDAAAAAGGIAIGQLYRSGSVIMCRVS